MNESFHIVGLLLGGVSLLLVLAIHGLLVLCLLSLGVDWWYWVWHFGNLFVFFFFNLIHENGLDFLWVWNFGLGMLHAWFFFLLAFVGLMVLIRWTNWACPWGIERECKIQAWPQFLCPCFFVSFLCGNGKSMSNFPKVLRSPLLAH